MVAEVLALLRNALPEGQAFLPDQVDAIGAVPGAYALVIELSKPVTFQRKALGRAELSGLLAYAGSANGPGGMRARLARHMRTEKPVRWHVDELTTCAAAMAAWAVPGGSECEIVAALLATDRFEVAMRGFGSSDCDICPAHLLRFTG